MHLYALFLAAGEGRRFGGGKLLRPYRGRPLVAYALDTLAEARRRGLIAGGIAVIPDRNTALRQLARDRGLRIVNNRDPGLGLSHSLQLGIEAMDHFALDPVPDATLVLLGDQPRVPLAAIEKVVEAWRGGAGPVIRPAYTGAGDEPGHPVILTREAWTLARTLSGDVGLGPLLHDRPELVTTVAVDGTNPDIDTPEDLARLDER
ncbi:MAG TPA: nucleotidyltransferase family protein [Gemmatimonadales bacterium]|nr:nucleotidyltransferase family protein [Gemmatimonadales bacterium]